MARSDKYEFRQNPASGETVQSAVRLIKLILRDGTGLLLQHRRMVIDAALWKITEAESRHKHRTRFCSQTVFLSPGCDCRHDHVFQRARMIDDLIRGGPNCADEVVSRAVACTITREEHSALNRHKDLDGWERYREAGITVIDAQTGQEFRASLSGSGSGDAIADDQQPKTNDSRLRTNH